MSSSTKEFEKKLNESKLSLDKLTDPNITLADSVTAYKSGMNELSLAQKMLDDAKLEYETIKEQVSN